MGVKIYSGRDLEAVPDEIKKDINEFKAVKEVIVPETPDDKEEAWALAAAFITISMTTHYVYEDRPVFVTYH